MFHYFLCVLPLLNALISDVLVTQDCSDKALVTPAGWRFCVYMATSKDQKGRTYCKAVEYEKIAREYCAKSCGFRH
ncbi:unnamed protein product [Haemonchus placei]|uniref:ShKT domain-containing protein n=1 Tax=Haemonchus placei TaxID=6290 RepID=A0A0N4WQ83_HAEPC|nr:unnamed protein product [Haemonchus placei]